MIYTMKSMQRMALASLVGVGLAISPAIAQASIPSAESNEAAPLLIAQTSNIVEIASESDDFDTLTTAVTTAGLADTLASDGPFTVFAPTDDAFAALPDGVLDALLEPENRDLLTDILTYHVVPDDVMSDELSTGGVETLNGGLAVRVDPDQVVVNDASVIQPDIEASNGVIHAINRVLIPMGVVEELQARMALEPASAEPVRALW